MPVGISFPDLVENGFDIRDLGIDLAAGEIFAEGFDQFADRTVFRTDQIGELDHGQALAFGREVFLEIIVTGKFAGEHRTRFAHLRLDERMSDPAHDRLSAVFLDALLDRPAAAQVVHDRDLRAGLVLGQDVLRDQGGEQIHLDDFAEVVDKAAAVGIAVERGSEIGSDFLDFRTDSRQRILLQRIGLMVRESAVEFLIERDDFEQVFDPGDLAGAHGVRVIDHDLELAVDLGMGTQEPGIFIGDIVGGDRTGTGGFFPLVFRNESLDIADAGFAAERNRVGAADLESVPFGGIVGGGDHHAGIRFEFAVGVVAHRSGTHAQVDHIGALFGNSFDQCFEQRNGMRPHVASDHHFLCLEKSHDRTSDLFRRCFVQLFRINAPDVISFVNSRHGPSPCLACLVTFSASVT